VEEDAFTDNNSRSPSDSLRRPEPRDDDRAVGLHPITTCGISFLRFEGAAQAPGQRER